MTISKFSYALGILALSYLCGRIFRVFFEDKDDMDLNFFTRTLGRFLMLCSLPGYLVIGWWLDSLIDGDNDRR